MGIVHRKNINAIVNPNNIADPTVETELEKQVRLIRVDNKTLRKENKDIKDLLEQVLAKLDEV